MNPTLAELQTLPARLREHLAVYEHLVDTLCERLRVVQEERDLWQATAQVLDDEVRRLQRLVKQ